MGGSAGWPLTSIGFTARSWCTTRCLSLRHYRCRSVSSVQTAAGPRYPCRRQQRTSFTSERSTCSVAQTRSVPAACSRSPVSSRCCTFLRSSRPVRHTACAHMAARCAGELQCKAAACRPATHAHSPAHTQPSPTAQAAAPYLASGNSSSPQQGVPPLVPPACIGLHAPPGAWHCQTQGCRPPVGPPCQPQNQRPGCGCRSPAPARGQGGWGWAAVAVAGRRRWELLVVQLAMALCLSARCNRTLAPLQPTSTGVGPPT